MKTRDLDEFYSSFWGDRWPLLRESLRAPERQVARLSAFLAVNAVLDSDFVPAHDLGLSRLVEATDSLRVEIRRDLDSGLLKYYIMDPASVWISRALDPQPGDVVLDMCAAPGGKSLVLAEMIEQAGELICNEPSPNRRDRLIKVIQQYVPRQVRERIRVTGKAGGLFSKTHPETFDRILVDAPCSGERHLLANKKELENWSSNRSERLALEQYALLSGALIAAKAGARIVYSTCSLSKLENDQVIQKLIKKKGDYFEVMRLDCPPEGEVTEFGVQFLPDQSKMGPLYACALIKHQEL